MHTDDKKASFCTSLFEFVYLVDRNFALLSGWILVLMGSFASKPYDLSLYISKSYQPVPALVEVSAMTLEQRDTFIMSGVSQLHLVVGQTVSKRKNEANRERSAPERIQGYLL